MIRAALNAAITALTAPLTLASLKTMLGLIADNTRSYTVYTALVSQTGTDTPSVIILENTLGGTPSFTYDDVGIYFVDLATAFTADKTFVQINLNDDGNGNQVTAKWETNNRISIHTLDNANAAANGKLAKAYLEIRIYE
jgi:hypothetical protein